MCYLSEPAPGGQALSISTHGPGATCRQGAQDGSQPHRWRDVRSGATSRQASRPSPAVAACRWWGGGAISGGGDLGLIWQGGRMRGGRSVDGPAVAAAPAGPQVGSSDWTDFRGSDTSLALVIDAGAESPPWLEIRAIAGSGQLPSSFLGGSRSGTARFCPRPSLRAGFVYEGRRVPLTGPQGIFKPAVLELPLSITSVPVVAGKARPYQDELGGDGLLQ